MTVLIRHLLGVVLASLRSREDLILENLALRQQLLVLDAREPRPRMGVADKVFWLALCRLWPGWT